MFTQSRHRIGKIVRFTVVGFALMSSLIFSSALLPANSAHASLSLLETKKEQQEAEGAKSTNPIQSTLNLLNKVPVVNLLIPDSQTTKPSASNNRQSNQSQKPKPQPSRSGQNATPRGETTRATLYANQAQSTAEPKKKIPPKKDKKPVVANRDSSEFSALLKDTTNMLNDLSTFQFLSLLILSTFFVAGVTYVAACESIRKHFDKLNPFNQ